MKKVEYKTPTELKLLTDDVRQETTSLVKRLKKKKPRNLDNVVRGLHDEAFDKFDCLDCANCCKTISPRLFDRDIERLSKHLRMKTSDFMDQYIRSDEEGEYIFRDQPCPFLMHDNYCMVYENRPKACREYPHTDRKRFFQVLPLSHKNCETCPVVYDIFEELKKRNLQLQ